MSLATILILNVAVATALLLLLGLTMRLPFRLQFSAAGAEQRRLLRRTREGAPAGAAAEAGRRQVGRPHLGEPAYSSD